MAKIVLWHWTQVDMFFVTPDIPDVVFTVAIVFLIAVGAFGIVANLSIFGLFFMTPAVS